MAKGKPTPEKSKIARGTTVAYARKQKPEGGQMDHRRRTEPEPASEAPEAEGAKAEAAKTEAEDRSRKAEAAKPEAAKTEAVSPTHRARRPKPDASPAAPARRRGRAAAAAARTATIAMPVSAPVGTLPRCRLRRAAAAAARRRRGPDVHARPARSPADRRDPAAAAGPRPARRLALDAPPRRHHEFALIYRQTYVISRFGVVGTRGQWRVVEYPTSASASHAYAKECSRFVSEGFSDYRD